ncbi:MAG: hypothetical protein H6868_01960 [Rhodospirillales bacterium]|nr:hypothetical protein [Rhodospirillales bacterium]
MKTDYISKKSQYKKLTRPADPFLTCDLTNIVPEEYMILPLADFYVAENEAVDLSARVPAFQNESDIFHWFARLLTQSPAAAALLAEASTQDWHVGLAALGNNGYHLDIPGRKILLDCYDMTPVGLARSAYFRNNLLFMFVKALRDVWHETRWSDFESHYRPEDILMLERVRAADCDTVALLAGWELRGAGYGDLWRHLIGTEEGDMALVFTKYLERDPSALFDGSALAYAFRQWFADESRVDGCDHDVLETLDEIMQAAETRNPFGKNRLSVACIEALSTLPDGVRYLAGLGETISRDPFFAGLHDPINQSHFLQIIYDLEVVMVGNVPFQDRALANKIFPQEDIHTIWR